LRVDGWLSLAEKTGAFWGNTFYGEKKIFLLEKKRSCSIERHHTLSTIRTEKPLQERGGELSRGKHFQAPEKMTG